MNCATKGMEMITSRSECERAAVSLNLLDTTIYSDNNPLNGRPYGCIYADNDWLSFSSPEGHPYSNFACGTRWHYDTYDCICKITGNLQLT